MISVNNNISLNQNTTYKVVLPFYAYAALSFLAATMLLFLSSSVVAGHYFQPQTLAITHLMALGWGTMIILGASHQLVPVLIEGKLFSNALAYLSFSMAAVGIPLLVYSFYVFSLGFFAQAGAILINAAIVSYVVNLLISLTKSKNENVHAIFVFTASLWLLLTAIVGLLLVYNFTMNILPKDSVHYLSLHAHIGILGWFLLMVLGTGSRLIPMFLISKYHNTSLLWGIYLLVNTGLLSFIFFFLYTGQTFYYLFPAAAISGALILFGYYCYKSYRQRIRKRLDDQMKISLLSVFMMVLPAIVLISIIILILVSGQQIKLILLYGFSVFFGWITAIILGMTFKTLPFIVWNKVYRNKAGLGKTPNPKDMFSHKLFLGMGIAYISGFVLFASGILFSNALILRSGTVFLLLTSILYNLNVFKVIIHKPATV